MDSLINAAARALATGDPLAALNRVALREDPPALALRGIAMAQLGDLERARALLRRAARGFGPKAATARARCRLAEAEIALALRELGLPAKTLDDARAVLEAHGDRLNAAYARHLQARRLLLLGRPGEAAATLEGFDPAPLPPPWRAAHELVRAGIALRRLQARAAGAALARAGAAARQAGIDALLAEVERVDAALRAPAARRTDGDRPRPLGLAEVEALLASDAFVVDACRNAVHAAGTTVALERRPVLFALARALAAAWPGDVPRTALIAQVFRMKFTDDTHRARLRVELGRLRKALRGLATIRATRRGYALQPAAASTVVVLEPPADLPHAAVLAMLADGEPWSSSALALALGRSQRSVQRALETLAAQDAVQSFGRGRARRWMTPPVPAFATPLLLPAAHAGD